MLNLGLIVTVLKGNSTKQGKLKGTDNSERS
jgi:hypothetical protein